jgi:hypothetical protein
MESHRQDLLTSQKEVAPINIIVSFQRLTTTHCSPSAKNTPSSAKFRNESVSKPQIQQV